MPMFFSNNDIALFAFTNLTPVIGIHFTALHDSKRELQKSVELVCRVCSNVYIVLTRISCRSDWPFFTCDFVIALVLRPVSCFSCFHLFSAVSRYIWMPRICRKPWRGSTVASERPWRHSSCAMPCATPWNLSPALEWAVAVCIWDV